MDAVEYSEEQLVVAAVQMTSTKNVEGNLQTAVTLCQRAIRAGASFIALPENYGFLGAERDKVAHAQDAEHGPFVAPLRELAAKHGVSILAGSVPEHSPAAGKVYNTSVLIGPNGSTVASYRKIHLFDVDIAEHTRFTESDYVLPGSEAVVAQLPPHAANGDAPVAGPWFVGLSVCYDLRFPELYRGLRARGARILTVPAAFTAHTGKDHWLPLLQARAIENQCYVVAPGQFGIHDPKRTTWGKSVLIDPWGTPLAMAPEREGFVLAPFEISFQDEVRTAVPCHHHRHPSEIFNAN